MAWFAFLLMNSIDDGLVNIMVPLLQLIVLQKTSLVHILVAQFHGFVHRQLVLRRVLRRSLLGGESTALVGGFARGCRVLLDDIKD